MVGLPARGKTYLAQKICRYFKWQGVSARVFNVGDYRRQNYGAAQPHSFFDPTNPEGQRQRNDVAKLALEDLIQWLEKPDSSVAVYDATNSTRDRREWIVQRCSQSTVPIETIFIESICEDASIILENIKAVKLSSPDYANEQDPDRAARDFQKRIHHYEVQYETISDEDDLTYVKLINVGSLVVLNHIQGYLQSRVVYYLMNVHITPRCIFFSRHGESMYNVSGKIGGDAVLSPRGEEYSSALPKLVRDNLKDQPMTVWTSTLRRTIQTAQELNYPKLQWKALDELDAGLCDGMTYEEIEKKYPEDYANRDKDKFTYRYRGGESYHDVVLRLEPIIMELERQSNILIIGHQAVLRCILGYFMNLSIQDIPYLRIPLHTLIKLTPRAYGCDEERFRVKIDAVDTHRPKPGATDGPEKDGEVPVLPSMAE
ncbi:fructose-2,6-bisphosphatase [Piptocephalis cylindrospora]|uniref:fructose-2,6-bisphosphate 2-phosphatase n=1 Tax=Piptocephalis cylindrospora TaxID=1907219 RepID=A0A4P9Y1Q7_9FUNG|nr:fructose-2,6-bisphosphatase [Piptocephalis cylindrospora]|eukprot:RKP12737.1 fructose-2,6-bisphosphatase [Piptocephalis cylindrospora]